MDTLAQRMQKALDAKSAAHQKVFIQADLARHCGVKGPSVSDWFTGETKKLKSETLLLAAEFLEVSPQWLATGRPPMLLGEAAYPDKNTSQSPSNGGAQINVPLAHPASYQFVSHELPKLSRESFLKSTEVPESFSAELFDDAMTPKYPKGTVFVWRRRQSILPGRLLLIRDKHGQPHVRMCVQGAEPGRWRAEATNSAYLSFDSHDEGLQVLAVGRGPIDPED